MSRIFITALIVGLLLWLLGFFLFLREVPNAPTTDLRTTDAIIVLTGGSGRSEEGLKLLKQNLAPRLFISGVGGDATATEIVAQNAPNVQVDPRKVWVGREAFDTQGNADETAKWMQANNVHSIRLVTSYYHLPRAIVEFRRVNQDVEVVQHPVFPAIMRVEHWWESPFTTFMLAKEYHKYLVANYRALKTKYYGDGTQKGKP